MNWIITTDSSISALVDLARAIGGPLTVVTVGDVDVDADAVLRVPLAEGTPAEALAPAVAAAVQAGDGDVVLVPNRPAERALAGAVAARLGAPVLTGVRAVEGGRIEQARYGGITVETVAPTGPVVIVADGGEAVSGGTDATDAAADGAHAARVTAQTTAETPEVNLQAARRIVAAGRGFRQEEDLQLARDLADALDAELAASRPLAEGLGWFPKNAYVGVTGVHVAPELYVAVGISGALLHSMGAAGARTVVVINDDPHATYFEDADYGIVGDLYQVLPQLTAALG